MATKKIKPTKEVGKFTAIFRFDDEEVSFTGETIYLCLEQFQPLLLKGKCIISVESDGKKSEIVMYPRFLRKLMVNPIFREITAKRLTLGLK